MSETQSRKIDVDGPLTAQMIQSTIHTSGVQKRLNNAYMSANPDVRNSADKAQRIVQDALRSLNEELKRARNTLTNADRKPTGKKRPVSDKPAVNKSAANAGQNNNSAKKQSQKGNVKPSAKSAPKKSPAKNKANAKAAQ